MEVKLCRHIKTSGPPVPREQPSPVPGLLLLPQLASTAPTTPTATSSSSSPATSPAAATFSSPAPEDPRLHPDRHLQRGQRPRPPDASTSAARPMPSSNGLYLGLRQRPRTAHRLPPHQGRPATSTKNPGVNIPDANPDIAPPGRTSTADTPTPPKVSPPPPRSSPPQMLSF